MNEGRKDYMKGARKEGLYKGRSIRRKDYMKEVSEGRKEGRK